MVQTAVGYKKQLAACQLLLQQSAHIYCWVAMVTIYYLGPATSYGKTISSLYTTDHNFAITHVI